MSVGTIQWPVSTDRPGSCVCRTGGKARLGAHQLSGRTYDHRDVGVFLTAVEDEILECYTFGRSSNDEVTG